MDYFKFLTSIRHNNIPPIIFLYGEENYFIDNIKRELQKQIVQNDPENLSTYDLEETPMEEVITDAETYPFFGKRKLIFAVNPTFLLARPPKLSFEHKLDWLERYIAAPVDYSTLVFIAPYEKIDNRKKVSQLLRKKTVSIKLDRVNEREVRKWIIQFAKLYNITLEGDALKFLETKLTSNLQLMESEMEKLSLYVKGDGVITKDTAEQLISSTIDGSALSLVDAVINRNYDRAFTIFKELVVMNENPIGLIALLSFQFRTILQVKLLKQKGYNEYQIQRQVGGHPYSIKLASDREKRFSEQRLIYIIDQLTETDAEIKTGRVYEDIAVELLLYELITN